MKVHKDDVIKLKPNADVTLSYKSGSPPAKLIKNALWIVDDIEEIDEELQNLNISTFEPDSRYNAGSFCSFVLNDDVLEVVKAFRLPKKENIMKKSELKQLIKEVINENKHQQCKKDLVKMRKEVNELLEMLREC